MPTPDTLDARPASREWTLLTDCRLKLGTATANGLRRNSLQVSKRQASNLLNELIDNWEVGGFDVDTEAQNRFELCGRSSTLAGKPDIIARRDDETVIVDAKTSQESPSHAVLVMIYLYAVPQGTGTAPKRQAQGAGHLPGPHGPRAGRGRRRRVRPEPGRAHPTDLGRRTREARA